MSHLRPPVLASSTVLNKAAFAQTIHLAAARVHEAKNIATIRHALGKSADLLAMERHPTVVSDPDTALAATGRKCLLLRPTLAAAQRETWGPVLAALVARDEVAVVPYALRLGYDHWTYRDVLTTLLPRALHDEIPAGFNTVGHVAHLNLRDQHLPYKTLIAQVLVDKNPHIRTVINKTSDVGLASPFRTFSYEVLAGPDDMMVEQTENGCVFVFNYAKVYWNSKLVQEHTRLLGLFRPGEVVCDVMAGIGPFAVPAGKKGVFVWANDYNPDSYKYLQDAIHRNKVERFVRPFLMHGRYFLQQAADGVLAASAAGVAAKIPVKRPPRTARAAQPDAPTHIPLPPTIAHFVMNLPESAPEFLRYFRGLYAGHKALFKPHKAAPLPVVHCHCFGPKPKSGDEGAPQRAIAARVSQELGAPLAWDEVIDEPGERRAPRDVAEFAAGTVTVHYVRDVAPHKVMYCASFRLPAEVIFAPR